MENKKSSSCNSAANSPHAERAQSEDKTDVISSDDSITVVEINRDDTTKSSTIDINDRNLSKENGSLKDGTQGHENKAFLHTEETTSGSSSGSSTSSPEPPVNFELKDMSPQCHPKIIASNSMEKVPIDSHDGLTTSGKDGRFGDDYLISINEHQKTGLKSEKLYVTQDSRADRPRRSCSKCVCASVGIVLVCAAITVAVLIGVGVLDPFTHFMNKKDRSINVDEPTIGAILQPGHSLNTINTVDTNKDNLNDDETAFPVGYVKNAYEGYFRITNHAWDSRLENRSSDMFKDLSATLEEGISEKLIPKDLNNEAEFYVTVLDFQPGSVNVHYRLSWIPDDAQVSEMLLSRRDAVESLRASLKDNKGILFNRYEIDQNSINIKFVPDMCREMQCGGECIYTKQYNNFVCTCPQNFYLNVDGISCVMRPEYIDGSSNNKNEFSEEKSTSPSNIPSFGRDLVEDNPLSTSTQTIVSVTENENANTNIVVTSIVEKEKENIEFIPTISSTTAVSPDISSSLENNPEPAKVLEVTSTTDLPTTSFTFTTTQSSIISSTLANRTLPDISTSTISDKVTTDLMIEEDNTEQSVSLGVTQLVKEHTDEGEVIVSRGPNVPEKSILVIPIITNDDNNITSTTLQTTIVTNDEPSWSNFPSINMTDDVDDVMNVVEGNKTEPSILTIKTESSFTNNDQVITEKQEIVGMTSNPAEIAEEDILSDTSNSTAPIISTDSRTVNLTTEATTQTSRIKPTSAFITTLTSNDPELMAGLSTGSEIIFQEEAEPITSNNSENTTTVRIQITTNIIFEDDSTESITIIPSPQPIERTTNHVVSILSPTVSTTLPSTTSSNTNDTGIVTDVPEKSQLQDLSSVPVLITEQEDITELTEEKIPGTKTSEAQTLIPFLTETSESEKNIYLLTSTLPPPTNVVNFTEKPVSNTTTTNFDLEISSELTPNIIATVKEQTYTVETPILKEENLSSTTRTLDLKERIASTSKEPNMDTTIIPSTELLLNLSNSATVHLKIPLINDSADAEELENKIREVLNAVSEQLLLDETDLSDNKTNKLNNTDLNDFIDPVKITNQNHAEADSIQEDNTTQQHHVLDVLPATPRKLDFDSAANSLVKKENINKEECGKWSLSNELKAHLLGQDAVNLNGTTIIPPTRLFEDQLPSVAYLLNVNVLNKISSCTASIINSKWLITSYNCVSNIDLNPERWAAFAGPYEAPTDKTNITKIKQVKNIMTHPSAKLTEDFYEFDIALIELSETFDLGDSIKSICIAEENPENGQLCITAGWSTKNQNGNSFYQYQEYIPVPSVEMDTCNSSLHYNGHLKEDVVCTGPRTDKKLCTNDSGAPLMCLDETSNNWKLYGIMSREGECLKISHPDIFASISVVKDWITNTIEDNQ